MCYFCFNFCSVFIFLISFLLNIGKEMSIFSFNFRSVFFFFFFFFFFFLILISFLLNIEKKCPVRVSVRMRYIRDLFQCSFQVLFINRSNILVIHVFETLFSRHLNACILMAWGTKLISKHSIFLYYEKTPIQIYRKFHLQKLKIFEQKILIFSYFCSKHRLWVLNRTASARWF